MEECARGMGIPESAGATDITASDPLPPGAVPAARAVYITHAAAPTRLSAKG